MSSNNPHPNGHLNGYQTNPTNGYIGPPTNGTNPPATTTQPTYFSSSTELADLGRERFDHDTAEITSRDHALLSHGAPISVRAGRAPRGLEAKVFEWNVFQHTTEDRDDREELKGDLHEGQLHRQNRAAREPEMGFGGDGFGGGGGGGFGGRGGIVGGGRGRGRGMGGFDGGRGGARGRGGRGGRGGRQEVGDPYGDALCAGRKPEGSAPPLAKGFAEELDKDMFWDGPIL